MKRVLCWGLCALMVLCMLPLGAVSFPSKAHAATTTYIPWKAAAWAKDEDHVENTGGKCAAFVSNALKAGGLSAVWDGDPGTLRSNILDGNYGEEHKMSDAKGLIKAGDVICIHSSKGVLHVMIVTRVTSDKIYFSQRNESRCDLGKTYSVMYTYHNYWDDGTKTTFLSMYDRTPKSSEPAVASFYNGHSYERFDYNLTWTQAKAFCEQRGGHLVTITDSGENSFIVNTMLSNCPLGVYYIGLSTPTVESQAWHWETPEGYPYENFDPQGEPSKGEGELYASIIGFPWPPNKQIGEWVDMADSGGTTFYSQANCGFICEYDSTGEISYAPANTLTYNGKIYERYDHHMSWTSAKAFCEQLGGHLVSITDAAEQQAVVDLLSGCTLGYYHIGASTPTPGRYGWSWVTGESFPYDNWDPEQPEPSAGSDEFYAAIIGVGNGAKKQTGEWIDEPDNGGADYYALSNSGFICEYDADTTPPTISDVTVTDVSPTGYTVTCRVSDDTGVARVSFPTWYANEGQTLWRDGTIANGIATFRVNVSDHNGANGCTYVTHIYAYDDAGNVSSVGDGTYSVLAVSVPAPDTTAPTISDVTVTDVSPTGYTVTCRVSDNTGIAEVRFPTWTLDAQDDLANPWPLGTLSNGTATFRVNISDHNGENGCTYRTHIYAYDLAGNHSVSSVDVEVPAPTSLFDLNGYLDGVIDGGLLDYGTADVYINGAPVAVGVSDYWEAWPVGTTYEVKNIKAADGRRYNGVYSGSLSGTVGTERTNVVLSFSNIYTFTFDADGGTGSMPDMQTAINDPVVLPNCGFTKDVCLFQGWEAYRPADNKYAISDVGWRTEEEMTAAGLTPTKYPAGLSFDFNTSWTEGTTGPVTIVLRPVWLAPDFVLPTSLRAIEAEAFEGAAFSFVKLPVGTASIGSRAFANCSNLTHIYIPVTATSIDPTAFAGTSGLTIHGADGSYAEFYAGKFGFGFVPVA